MAFSLILSDSAFGFSCSQRSEQNLSDEARIRKKGLPHFLQAHIRSYFIPFNSHVYSPVCVNFSMFRLDAFIVAPPSGQCPKKSGDVSERLPAFPTMPHDMEHLRNFIIFFGIKKNHLTSGLPGSFLDRKYRIGFSWRCQENLQRCIKGI